MTSVSTADLGPALVDELNFVLISFLVGCAVPMNIVSSVFFVAFVTMLNPAYGKVMPSRTALTRTWLPKLTAKVSKRIRALRKKNRATAPFMTLGADGVKTQGGEVYNFTESVDKEVYFIECVDPGISSVNRTFLSENAIRLITSIAAAAGSSPMHYFCACVMDNTSTNLAAFALLNVAFPWLICIGCRTHFFDLVIEDVFEILEFKNILKEVL